jgi:hypothetical protein
MNIFIFMLDVNIMWVSYFETFQILCQHIWCGECGVFEGPKNVIKPVF